MHVPPTLIFQASSRVVRESLETSYYAKKLVYYVLANQHSQCRDHLWTNHKVRFEKDLILHFSCC